MSNYRGTVYTKMNTINKQYPIIDTIVNNRRVGERYIAAIVATELLLKFLKWSIASTNPTLYK